MKKLVLVVGALAFSPGVATAQDDEVVVVRVEETTIGVGIPFLRVTAHASTSVRDIIVRFWVGFPNARGSKQYRYSNPGDYDIGRDVVALGCGFRCAPGDTRARDVTGMTIGTLSIGARGCLPVPVEGEPPNVKNFMCLL